MQKNTSIEAPPTILGLKQQQEKSTSTTKADTITKVDIDKSLTKADTITKVEFDYIIQVKFSNV